MLKKTLPIALSCSGVLGFYRGTQEYKYNYNKSMKRYEDYIKKYPEDKDYKKPYYFYINNIMYGLAGTFFYINPFSFPIMIGRELYRLEVNMRDESDELKHDYDYYRII
jgi:hypothetical protein